MSRPSRRPGCRGRRRRSGGRHRCRCHRRRGRCRCGWRRGRARPGIGRRRGGGRPRRRAGGAARPRHRRRGVPRISRGRAAALVAVLAVAALAGGRYQAAKADLADTRDRLAEARADLAAEQEALTVAQHRAELTQASIDQVRSRHRRRGGRPHLARRGDGQHARARSPWSRPIGSRPTRRACSWRPTRTTPSPASTGCPARSGPAARGDEAGVGGCAAGRGRPVQPHPGLRHGRPVPLRLRRSVRPARRRRVLRLLDQRRRRGHPGHPLARPRVVGARRQRPRRVAVLGERRVDLGAVGAGPRRSATSPTTRCARRPRGGSASRGPWPRHPRVRSSTTRGARSCASASSGARSTPARSWTPTAGPGCCGRPRVRAARRRRCGRRS